MRRHRNVRRQARLQTQLRYGAEGSALRQLAREEDASLQAGLAFEAGAASAIVAAALASKKPLRRQYRESGQARNQTYKTVRGDLSGLSGAADPFRAAAAKEFGLTKTLMARERANALRDADAEARGAKAGQVYAQKNLLATHKANMDKIRLRRAELRHERGAFKASTFEDLLAARREAARDLRNDRWDRRQDRVDNRAKRRDQRLAEQKEQRMREEANKPDGDGGLSPSEKRQRRNERRDRSDNIAEARTWFGNLMRGKNADPESVRDILITGGELPAGGGKTVKIPSLEAWAVRKAYRRYKRKQKNAPAPGQGVNSIPGISG